MKTEYIAKICHQANKAYCESIGDFSQHSWEAAPFEIKASAVDGVEYRLANPKATPKDMHDNWLATKKEQGWVYGEKKNEELKQHPCMVPYADLPEAQKLKDELFSEIVNVFAATMKETKNVNKAK